MFGSVGSVFCRDVTWKNLTPLKFDRLLGKEAESKVDRQTNRETDWETAKVIELVIGYKE